MYIFCYVSCFIREMKFYTQLIRDLLTYLLTPWSRVLLEKLVLQLVKKFPAFFGTRRSITVLTLT